MASPAVITLPFTYNFLNDARIEEGSENSPYYKVNSGAYWDCKGGWGKTIQGPLPSSDKWYQVYGKTPGSDAYVNSDGGKHPQNIFRLYGRQAFKGLAQQLLFKANRFILSSAPERKESNGFVLGWGDATGQYVYYAALRVDGLFVLKRKNGSVSEYATLGQKRVIDGTYDRVTNPSLIPVGKAFRVGLCVSQEGTGKRVKGFLNGVEMLSVLDATPLTIASGFPIIRTDFMDADFDEHELAEPGKLVITPPPTPAKTYEQGWNERGDQAIGFINATRK